MAALPVRIAFVITELDEGGAERALVHLVTRLDQSQWEPGVFSLAGRGPLTAKLEAARVPVFDCGATSASSPLQIWRAYSRLRRELTLWQPQIVQAFLFHANLLARVVAWRAGVPHFLSGIRVADRRGRLRLRLDRWTERLVEKHVCVSRAVAQFSAQSGLDPGKLVVIPNGVDLEQFRDARPVDRSRFDIPAHAKVVLSVGRLDAQKDPFCLLSAFEAVAEKINAAELVFVGDGPLRDKLALRISRSRFRDRIHLVGWQRDVAGWLKTASVFALASRFEGMPNAVLEAGAAGVPVVATRAEGLLEIVEDRQTGWLVGIGDAPALAASLTEALTDPTAAEKGIQLQSVIATRFTWEQTVSAYDRLYLGLLDEAQA